MSTLSITPLGDTEYFDLNGSSLNGFGVLVPYIENTLGGAIPSNIPNPGPVDFTPQYGAFMPTVVVPVCIVGCASAPPVDDQVVPEIGSAWMAAAFMGVLILRRMR